MCTSIVEIIEVEGKARSKDGWFAATRAVLTYDHPQFALTERDTINLDFVDPNRSASERGAVELSLDSAKALHAALGRVINTRLGCCYLRSYHDYRLSYPCLGILALSTNCTRSHKSG